MSWDNWNKQWDRLNKALEAPRNQPFSESGLLGLSNSEIREGTTALDEPSATYCRSNGDCGAGFACVNGACMKVYTIKDNKVDSCGSETAEWPCEPIDSIGGCDTPGLGDCDSNPDCPGEKCCRAGASGDIKCWCSDCEDVEHGICSVYCDQLYKSFGTVGPGCSLPDKGTGDCGGNICTECAFCDDTSLGFTGVPVCNSDPDEIGNNDAPCWCKNLDCKKCITDKNDPNYGEYVDDEENCMDCCTQANWECSHHFPNCNKTVNGSHCEPVNSPKPCITALREKLYAECEADCQNEDVCAPTGSLTHCTGDPPFVCPSGYICEQSGTITSGGNTCTIYDTWKADEVPEECESCGCNCNDDCGTCQTCGENGECINSGGCDGCRVDMYIEWSFKQTADNVCFGVPTCYIDRLISASTLYYSEEPYGNYNPLAWRALTPDNAIRGIEHYSLVYEDLGIDPNITRNICPACQDNGQGEPACIFGTFDPANRIPCDQPSVTAYLAYDGVKIPGYEANDWRALMTGCYYDDYCGGGNNPIVYRRSEGKATIRFRPTVYAGIAVLTNIVTVEPFTPNGSFNDVRTTVVPTSGCGTDAIIGFDTNASGDVSNYQRWDSGRGYNPGDTITLYEINGSGIATAYISEISIGS